MLTPPTCKSVDVEHTRIILRSKATNYAEKTREAIDKANKALASVGMELQMYSVTTTECSVCHSMWSVLWSSREDIAWCSNCFAIVSQPEE